ncbi:MAG: hypothetical protein PHY16_04760 [Methylobacter sp.]|nr:hypothetical protein [Methylobacter sp.]
MNMLDARWRSIAIRNGRLLQLGKPVFGLAQSCPKRVKRCVIKTHRCCAYADFQYAATRAKYHATIIITGKSHFLMPVIRIHHFHLISSAGQEIICQALLMWLKDSAERVFDNGRLAELNAW